MNPIQKTANWIKSRRTPSWLKRLGSIMQQVTVDVFQILGKEAVDFLKSEIFRQSALSISGEEKLKNVVLAFTSNYKDVDVPKRILNLAVEMLLAQLIKEDIIK